MVRTILRIHVGMDVDLNVDIDMEDINTCG